MAIQHHPHEATLMSYAAGSLSEALSAVVACHAAHCPTCGAVLREMEEIGAALLDALPPSPVSNHGIPAGQTQTATDGDEIAGGDVPVPLRHLIGPELAGIPWRRLGFGVWHLPLKLSAGAKGDLRLLKVAPGRAMPEHGHGGTELTLMLQGSYRDEVGTFRTGDVADLDDDIEHRPVADPQTGCICLIASEEKARFKGLVARLVQPLTGI